MLLRANGLDCPPPWVCDPLTCALTFDLTHTHTIFQAPLDPSQRVTSSPGMRSCVRPAAAPPAAWTLSSFNSRNTPLPRKKMISSINSNKPSKHLPMFMFTHDSRTSGALIQQEHHRATASLALCLQPGLWAPCCCRCVGIFKSVSWSDGLSRNATSAHMAAPLPWF